MTTGTAWREMHTSISTSLVMTTGTAWGEMRLRGGRLRAGGVPGVGAVHRLARPSTLLVLLIFNSRTVGRRQGMVSAQPDSPPGIIIFGKGHGCSRRYAPSRRTCPVALSPAPARSIRATDLLLSQQSFLVYFFGKRRGHGQVILKAVNSNVPP